MIRRWLLETVHRCLSKALDFTARRLAPGYVDDAPVSRKAPKEHRIRQELDVEVNGKPLSPEEVEKHVRQVLRDQDPERVAKVFERDISRRPFTLRG